jgi:hypothetical protein
LIIISYTIEGAAFKVATLTHIIFLVLKGLKMKYRMPLMDLFRILIKKVVNHMRYQSNTRQVLFTNEKLLVYIFKSLNNTLDC